MQSLRLFLLIIGLMFLGNFFVSAQIATKQFAKIATPPQISPQGDGLGPEKRRVIFFQTITETLRQMPPEAQKDLMMVGTGSWMSTDKEKRAGANDIDATISYLNGDHRTAQAFQKLFEENLEKRGLKPPPSITLFVDEKDEGKQDFYRGPTGNYFFYTHSRNNNPFSMFDVSLNEEGLQLKPEKVEEFWTRRGKDIPAKIAQANLFVEDNKNFLKHNFDKEDDYLKKALTTSKYVDRVEEMLKEEIQKQWGKDIVVPDHLKHIVAKTYCMRRYFHLLEYDLQPNPGDRQRVMDCLGANTKEEFQNRVAEFFGQANQYFDETEKQVEEAENEVVLPTDEIPGDISKNTGQVKVDQYFVLLLTNASYGLYISTIDAIKTAVRCSFEGGGINCKSTDLVTYKKLLGPFATRAEAQEALCQSITETKYFPLGVGLKGRWQGGSSWYGLWNASVSGCPAK